VLGLVTGHDEGRGAHVDLDVPEVAAVDLPVDVAVQWLRICTGKRADDTCTEYSVKKLGPDAYHDNPAQSSATNNCAFACSAAPEAAHLATKLSSVIAARG